MGISNRRTKATTITSCDNAFVTNNGAAAASPSRKKHLLTRDPGASIASEAAHWTPPEKRFSQNGDQLHVMII
ncbi:hypothetical protein AN161_20565 [Lysinibacillus sp. FJAT-14222]|nr:hypothetical protein AN161_20565 [Lysinibacillus sp. FJAT-14222]